MIAPEFVEVLAEHGCEPKPTGPSQWTARCPGHEDRVASLSVGTGGDGRALLTCHAGCDTEAITRAVGCRVADLFPDATNTAPIRQDNGNPDPLPADDALHTWQSGLATNMRALDRLYQLRGWTPEALAFLGVGFDRKRLILPVYDRAGKLVNLLRYLPGDRANGERKMLALKGRTRDLWPAPETIEGNTLWLVEGEPDAISAASMGLPGVAIPGVNGWRSEWASRIAGRRVTICFDCDEPGRKAAQRVLSDLAGVADARVLDLEPERTDGYDLSDALLEGADRELLLVMSEAIVTDAAVNGSRRTGANTGPVPQAGDLLGRVIAFLRRYVVFPGDDEALILGLWVLHTWAFDAAHATPYLTILSPTRRTGKTLLLEVLELLVRAPWRVAAGSEAAMFRKIAASKPTLLLDEVDAIFGSNTERTEGLRGILNAGNRPGASVARCVGKGSEQHVVDFPVYCPKLLAGIDTGRLPDTIRDRAIDVRMMRRKPGEPVERFRRRFAESDAASLCGDLSSWASQHVEELRAAEPAIPTALNDRAADAWEPLLAIADLAGEELAERVRGAAIRLGSDLEADESHRGIQALACLRRALLGRDQVSTAELLRQLNDDDDLPFGGWRDGRGLDARALAKLLKPFGLKSRTVRIEEETPKGYSRDLAMEEAFARYLPSEAPQAPQAQHSTPLQPDVADVADVAALTGREPPAAQTILGGAA